jgi:hypothetical protein
MERREHRRRDAVTGGAVAGGVRHGGVDAGSDECRSAAATDMGPSRRTSILSPAQFAALLKDG